MGDDRDTPYIRGELSAGPSYGEGEKFAWQGGKNGGLNWVRLWVAMTMRLISSSRGSVCRYCLKYTLLRASTRSNK